MSDNEAHTFISDRQAAATLNIDVETIHDMLEHGELTHAPIDGFVDAAAPIDFARHRRIVDDTRELGAPRCDRHAGDPYPPSRCNDCTALAEDPDTVDTTHCPTHPWLTLPCPRCRFKLIGEPKDTAS